MIGGAVSKETISTKTTTFSSDPTFHSLECNEIRRGEMEESVVPEALLFLCDYSMFRQFSTPRRVSNSSRGYNQSERWNVVVLSLF